MRVRRIIAVVALVGLETVSVHAEESVADLPRQ